MKQKTLATIFLLTLTATLFTGCNSEQSKPQTVVVNVAAIAKATGMTEHIKERRETMNQQISEEMKALSAELTKEFEEEKASVGDSPSDEGEKRIQALQEQLRNQIIQAGNEKNLKRANDISKLSQSYLESFMTVAQKVAREHGASIILKAHGVFWSEESVDITDEVIGRLSDGRNILLEGEGQN